MQLTHILAEFADLLPKQCSLPAVAQLPAQQQPLDGLQHKQPAGLHAAAAALDVGMQQRLQALEQDGEKHAAGVSHETMCQL